MRLIDADALQNLFNEVSTSLLAKPELRKDTEHMVRAFLMTTEMMQDAPTEDAVPVVRCQNCVKRGKGDCPMEQDYPWISSDSNGFCHLGSQK